jgi:hypothetical protein
MAQKKLGCKTRWTSHGSVSCTLISTKVKSEAMSLRTKSGLGTLRSKVTDRLLIHATIRPSGLALPEQCTVGFVALRSLGGADQIEFAP